MKHKLAVFLQLEKKNCCAFFLTPQQECHSRLLTHNLWRFHLSVDTGILPPSVSNLWVISQVEILDDEVKAFFFRPGNIRQASVQLPTICMEESTRYRMNCRTMQTDYISQRSLEAGIINSRKQLARIIRINCYINEKKIKWPYHLYNPTAKIPLNCQNWKYVQVSQSVFQNLLPVLHLDREKYTCRGGALSRWSCGIWMALDLVQRALACRAERTILMGPYKMCRSSCGAGTAAATASSNRAWCSACTVQWLSHLINRVYSSKSRKSSK